MTKKPQQLSPEEAKRRQLFYQKMAYIEMKKLRQTIKTDYRDATSFINEELGECYTAADIQAITWVTHKRIHNV